MRDTTSYTELSTLARCEMMWTLRYRDKAEQPEERAHYFKKGTWLHDLAHGWWIGGDAEHRAYDSVFKNVPGSFEDAEIIDDVAWLYDRYTRHYGSLRAEGRLRVVETELKVVNALPSTDVNVVTYIDQLVWVRDVKGANGLYAVERKSMADWKRLDTLDVDPQVGITLWQLRNAGWPVQGVLYDAIRTYRWKPEKPTLTALMDEAPASFTKAQQREWARLEQESRITERPLTDSFQLHVTDRDARQTAAVVEDMRTAVRRRAVLGAGEVPMRNIGPTCDRCSFKNECHGDLIFPELAELRNESRAAGSTAQPGRSDDRIVIAGTDAP